MSGSIRPGEAIRAMANQLVVSVDSEERLVAKKNYVYAKELNNTEVFYIDEQSDGSVTLQSAENKLFVCLSDQELVASCNESISGQKAARFVRVCYSHFTGVLPGTGNCKVFGLRCLTNNRLVTVNLKEGNDYGVLKVEMHTFWGQNHCSV